MIEITHMGVYEATVKIRLGESFPNVRPAAAALDGQRYRFQAVWLLEDRPWYDGEWAMAPLVPFSELPLSWIASGDLADLSEQEKGRGNPKVTPPWRYAREP